MPPSEPTATPPPERGGGHHVRFVVLSSILALVVLAVGFAGMQLLTALKQEPQQAERRIVRTAVRVEIARHGMHRERLTGYGRARALRHADVPAEIAATVVWIAPELDAGRLVTAGQELVRLDPRDAATEARSAEARLRQADAKRVRAASDVESLGAQIDVATRELDVTQRELVRLQELSGKATSESEIDGQRMAVALREQSVIGLKGRRSVAQADQRAADAEIAAAEAALERAQRDLERAVVRAPYDGSIVRREAQLGERVSAGTSLFSLVDLRRVELPVSLPASRYGEIAVGARAEVRLREGGDTVWSGQVSRLSATVDAERRTFDAFLDIVAIEEQIAAPVAPGAFAVVTVDGRVTEDVVAVPREAFVAGAIYVAEPEGAPDPETGAREAVVRELRPTVTRRLPDVVLVGEGLPEGSLVIVTSVDQIADGSRVLVLTEDDSPAGEGGR